LRLRIGNLLSGIAVGNAADNDADRYASSPDTRLAMVSQWVDGDSLAPPRLVTGIWHKLSYAPACGLHQATADFLEREPGSSGDLVEQLAEQNRLAKARRFHPGSGTWRRQ
jgi:hypothetical protein